MDHVARHRCLLYRGAPSVQLSLLARLIRDKLDQNHRCLYLNSPSMVAGMKSYLAPFGVDAAYELARGSLVMSSERHHLADGKSFSPDRMIENLEQCLENALNDGYSGLWATGDMTWELGNDVGSPKLLEYELKLDEFMRSHPKLCGICQYHLDSLPMTAARDGMRVHREIFINDTLSLINPYHFTPEAFRMPAAGCKEGIDGFIEDVSRTPIGS